jgi:hypothetical protein
MSVHFSWPSFREPLKLDVEAAEIDGRPLAAEAMDGANKRIVLTGPAVPPWETLRLRLRLGPGDSTTPPELSEGDACLAGIAILTADRGLTRIPAPLDSQPGESATFEGDLCVRREEIAGKASLQGEMTATIHGVGHRIVGTSSPWALIIEPGDAPKAAPSPIKTQWIEFSEPPPGLESLVEYADVPIHLALGAEPVLYLNKGLDLFHAVLGSEHARGPKKTVRDLLGGWVATAVTHALVREGFDDLGVEDDDTVRLPTDPVVLRAMNALVEHLQSVDSLDELARRVEDASEDAALRRALWAEVFMATSRLTTAGVIFEQAAKRVIDAG